MVTNVRSKYYEIVIVTVNFLITKIIGALIFNDNNIFDFSKKKKKKVKWSGFESFISHIIVKKPNFSSKFEMSFEMFNFKIS